MGPSLIRAGFLRHIYGGGQDPDYLIRCVRTAVWSVVHGVFGLVCGGTDGVNSAILCAPEGFCYVSSVLRLAAARSRVQLMQNSRFQKRCNRAVPAWSKHL